MSSCHRLKSPIVPSGSRSWRLQRPSRATLRPMVGCPTCGHENAPGAKFCSECGTAMPAFEAALREERKIVTVVFADLVGFTSRAERLDPEDVRALLSPYYSRLRTELERFGGTVEKFIGDAVVALFGAPVAHEDDPERAVRAALAIRDWVLDQDTELRLRIAVNTGEALIALGARPAQGEGMASGDVVNTAARLQAAAPVNSILVGDSTYRATRHVIDYRAVEPVEAKGKADPVGAWEAIEARSRVGDLLKTDRAPLIGRAKELGLVTDLLDRVRRERTSQLVTIAGVPGIGKSRLVAEFFGLVDQDPTEIVRWRQGRTPPYGDGVTFWALAEMVKAEAGILGSDAPDEAGAKLQRSVGLAISDPVEAQWVAGHLRPLVGISLGTEAGGDQRGETFAAWRRFLEALAENGPLVLVFEDLHWADVNLLDFIDHLVEWAGAVPLLIVCTARPELFERRPGWGGGARNATTLSLSPLSDTDTARLIGSLMAQPVIDLPLPETVQGIIAARIDALKPDEKSLLQDAAVIGKGFWLGAVAGTGDIDRTTAELRLHALERKDFIQRVRRSSVADEAEFTFLHVLVRDVAYGQIPRGQRAEKHVRAAGWIASLGRSEDHAEMLAHHYLSALELRRASGQPTDAAFAERALESLREAGARAFSLNAYANAARFFESALELAGEGTPERAHLLLRLGRARYFAGDYDAALLESASASLLAYGDQESAAESESLVGQVYWVRGEHDQAFAHLGRARELVEGRDVSAARASVASNLSRLLMLEGDDVEAVRGGREALSMAEQLGLDALRAHALNNIGVARVHVGDYGGFDDIEAAVAVAVEVKAPDEICRALNNLAATLWEFGQLARACTKWEEAAENAARFGQTGQRRFGRGVRVEFLYSLGRWDDSWDAANEFLAEVEAGRPHYLAPRVYTARALVRLGRDDVAGALSDAETALAQAPMAKDLQLLIPIVSGCANVIAESGDIDRAAAIVDEFMAQPEVMRGLRSISDVAHMMAWTFAAIGRAQEMIDALSGVESGWAEAARCYASGDLRRAADVCGDMDAVTDEAHDRQQLAEALIAQGRRAEADVELHRALSFYRSVGATRYVRRCESMLTASA
ncbi:MAG: zinc-ribbon domain-containing protein [Chloroflexi bacterium]|nr:MAG: zinc-ribbon domain-containing protein [Chloroflexota bacterium]